MSFLYLLPFIYVPLSESSFTKLHRESDIPQKKIRLKLQLGQGEIGHIISATYTCKRLANGSKFPSDCKLYLIRREKESK